MNIPSNNDPPKHQQPEKSSYDRSLEELSTSDLVTIWQHFANIGGSDKDRMVAILSILLPLLVAATGFAAKSFISASNLLAVNSSATQTINQQLLLQAAIVAVVAAIISSIGALITLMYAGYANRNWSKADKIAIGFLLRDTASLKRRVLTSILHTKKIDIAAKALEQSLTPCREKYLGIKVKSKKSLLKKLFTSLVKLLGIDLLTILLALLFMPLLPFTLSRVSLCKFANYLAKPHYSDGELAPIFTLFYRLTQFLALINIGLFIAIIAFWITGSWLTVIKATIITIIVFLFVSLVVCIFLFLIDKLAE